MLFAKKKTTQNQTPNQQLLYSGGALQQNYGQQRRCVRIQVPNVGEYLFFKESRMKREVLEQFLFGHIS